MLIYKNTFENVKTLNCNFPIEDQFYASDTEAIIADGITRDPIGISDLKSCSFSKMIKLYPRPSGGELAAREIVKAFIESKGTLKERLIACNQKVKILNDKYIKECDYLENDYYGAVASCISIENNILNYAFICDCGIIVYDHLGNIKFQTEDEKEIYSDPFIDSIKTPWNLPETRVIVRRDYRNNLNNIVNDQCVSYGAITGELSAINFIRTGTLKLSKGDFIILYSDGFINYLHEKDFINNILNFNKLSFEKYIENKSQDNPEQYGREKTVILFKNN